jgi:hypothetical protein
VHQAHVGNHWIGRGAHFRSFEHTDCCVRWLVAFEENEIGIWESRIKASRGTY